MNESFAGSFTTRDRIALIGFLFCTVLCFIGILAGTLSASDLSDVQGDALRRFFYSVEGGAFVPGNLRTSLAKTFLFHIMAVLLGFSAVGFALLPLLSFVRGFSLAFASAAVTAALGRGGVWVALALIGLPSLIALPCFFELSVQAFSASYSLAGGRLRDARTFNKEYINRCAVCFTALLIAALADAYLAPVLASVAAGKL